jgi:hypothetical protein
MNDRFAPRAVIRQSFSVFAYQSAIDSISAETLSAGELTPFV